MMPWHALYMFGWGLGETLFALGVGQAVVALRLAQLFHRRWPRAKHRKLTPNPPPAAVIVPVTGDAAETQRNVRAILRQDYPRYRVLFAVESEQDPAAAMIRRLIEREPAGKAELVVAGRATRRGQKVHNQLAAVDRTTDADLLLAFMDADAQPGADWLHALVDRLADSIDPTIAATTGYRFYVPTSAHPANAIVAVVNAGVATLLGRKGWDFVWGGTMAMRRAEFFSLGVHAAWQQAVSDDYALSLAVGAAGRRVEVARRCLLASDGDFNWQRMWNFAIRQYRITKVAVPRVFAVLLVGSVLQLFTLFFPVWAVLHCNPRWIVWWGGLWGLVAGMLLARGVLLMRGAEQMLPEDAERIHSLWPWFTFLYPVAQVVNLVAVVASALGRVIVWRGIAYRMETVSRTVVVREPAAEVEEAEV